MEISSKLSNSQVRSILGSHADGMSEEELEQVNHEAMQLAQWVFDDWQGRWAV